MHGGRDIMAEEKSFWGEVPNSAEPRVKADLSDKKIDKRWLWAIAAAVALLIIGVVVNINHGTTGPTTTTSALDIDNGDLKINWDRYATTNLELTESLTIANSGVYRITGSLENGSILVNAGANGEVKLILDNVSIKNSSGPAIRCIAGEDLVIELVGDNYLEDGASYSGDLDEDANGVIYSKADLTFGGEGSLVLTANYQDAIVAKDDLKFNDGTYNITAADDGIRGKDSVYIVNGNFNIVSKGDSIKSTNDTDAGKGFVLIENGNIEIASGDDGIHAIRTLMMQGGAINISKSYEGLEAQKIIINNGEVSVMASDDGINAGGSSDNASTNAMAGDANCELTINGGNVYVNAAGDGVDSNGYTYFNGGKVIVDGPTNNGNGSLDSGLGIIMNGGEVIAVGFSGMASNLGSASSINNISVYFTSSQSAGTKIEIKNSNDETILEHTSAKTFNHMSAGSAYFKTGETYTIYLNGTKYQDFVIADIVTTVGNSNSNNMMPQGGNRR